MKMGKLVVIEGLDGCGKGTNAEEALNWFKLRSLPVYHSREPGGSPFAEEMRKTLLSKEHNVPPMAEVLGMYSARIEHTQNVLIPKLKAGINVVCERYFMSSFGYNHAEEIHDVHKLCLPYILEPDVTIFLDITPSRSQERVRMRKIKEGAEPDRIELKPLEYFKKVFFLYQENLPMLKNLVHLDGNAPMDVIAAQVHDILETLMEK